ncbi:MAG: BrnT family toxin [Coriobacteriia bacterium]|nr:BrnT family toxin [Coriobacteriia bacterium]
MYTNKYRFEWDESKEQINLAKHGISFKDAQQAFYDEDCILKEDLRHSGIEKRYYCLGHVKGKVATVRFTVRRGRIRIIGAGYWRKGRSHYEGERRNRIQGSL